MEATQPRSEDSNHSHKAKPIRPKTRSRLSHIEITFTLLTGLSDQFPASPTSPVAVLRKVPEAERTAPEMREGSG